MDIYEGQAAEKRIIALNKNAMAKQPLILHLKGDKKKLGQKNNFKIRNRDSGYLLRFPRQPQSPYPFARHQGPIENGSNVW